MDRALPSDVEAERAVLGSILLNREALIVVMPWLEPGHMYLEKHAWIYEAMLDCLKRGTPPDTSTVSTELRRRERLEPIGGLLYLIDLANSVPTAVHIDYYAQAVERTAIHRRMISVGGKIAALGFDERLELEQLETEARQQLDGALARKSDAAVLPVKTLAERALSRLTAQERRGTASGYLDIDDIIGGFQPGEMAVLAGRPSMGKTALMLCLMYRIAKRQEPVLIFSLEMTADQLFDRLACIHANLPYEELFLKGGIYRNEEAAAVYTNALSYLAELPIFVDETPGLSTADMQRRALLKTHEIGNFALIGIDYLQLMTAPGVKADDYAIATAASKAATTMAKTCRAPVLALSQLSRAPEQRADHIPQLSDLRGSGQIEQDAAVVMFPYREEKYDPDTDKKGIAEIHIPKHRNGRTGVVALRFEGPSMSFMDLERYRAPEGY